MEAEFYIAPIQNKDTNTSCPVCQTKMKLRPLGAIESEESKEDDISPGESNNIIDGIPGLSDILCRCLQLAPTLVG